MQVWAENESRAVADLYLLSRKSVVRRAYFAGLERNTRTKLRLVGQGVKKALLRMLPKSWPLFFQCQIVLFSFIAVLSSQYLANQKIAQAEALQASTVVQKAEEEPANVSGPESLAEFDPDEGIVLKLSKTLPQPTPQEKELP